MSERTTVVELTTESGERLPGILDRGHAERAAVLAMCRRHYEQQLRDAQDAIAALDAGRVRVFHQRGVYVDRDRREVLS